MEGRWIGDCGSVWMGLLNVALWHGVGLRIVVGRWIEDCGRALNWEWL